MHIVDTIKFLIGLAFFGAGLAMLLSTRNTRGFGQRKQAGVLMLVAGAVFVAIGLGYLDIRAMMGR